MSKSQTKLDKTKNFRDRILSPVYFWFRSLGPPTFGQLTCADESLHLDYENVNVNVNKWTGHSVSQFYFLAQRTQVSLVALVLISECFNRWIESLIISTN